MVGIYKIENLKTHKVYIGQSVHIERRWREHCNSKSNSLIHKAIISEGKENFSFEVLEECSMDSLNEREAFYIQKYDCMIPKGYNIMECQKGVNSSYAFLDKTTTKGIISDIKNTSLSFYTISEKWGISKRDVYYFNNGDVHRMEDENYPLRQLRVEKEPFYCIDCGVQITQGATRCRNCLSLKSRKVERPNRNELKELIRTTAFTKIGEKFGVSDNAIRKWCIQENLPTKKTEIKKYSDEEWAAV